MRYMYMRRKALYKGNPLLLLLCTGNTKTELLTWHKLGLGQLEGK